MIDDINKLDQPPAPVSDAYLRAIASDTPNLRVKSLCLELIEIRALLARADMLLLNFHTRNVGFTGGNIEATREYLRDRGVIA